jgi:hypothetical protein
MLLLLISNYNFAQRESLIIDEEELIDKNQDLYNLSPDGALETIFDQYGKKYKLEALLSDKKLLKVNYAIHLEA